MSGAVLLTSAIDEGFAAAGSTVMGVDRGGGQIERLNLISRSEHESQLAVAAQRQSGHARAEILDDVRSSRSWVRVEVGRPAQNIAAGCHQREQSRRPARRPTPRRCPYYWADRADWY